MILYTLALKWEGCPGESRRYKIIVEKSSSYIAIIGKALINNYCEHLKKFLNNSAETTIKGCYGICLKKVGHEIAFYDNGGPPCLLRLPIDKFIVVFDQWYVQYKQLMDIILITMDDTYTFTVKAEGISQRCAMCSGTGCLS